MCKIICVTNRKLCPENFFDRIRRICDAGADALILREKDLSSSEYHELAEKVSEICRVNGVSFIRHSYPFEGKGDAIHLPLPMLRVLEHREDYSIIGSSVHSVSEAQEAQSLGAAYLTAGHIFETDCKAGLPGRGVGFLSEVCSSVTVPVYAIGGITPENAGKVIRAGAAGICVMSSLMTCKDLSGLINELRRGMNER